MSTSSSRKNFLSLNTFGLIDVLANCVAISLIFIFIHVLTSEYADTLVTDQEEEISLILSRKIATSLIVGKIPVSKSARLHNYKQCNLRRNRSPHTQPTIELHSGYIFIRDQNLVVTREQLLQKNNLLDQYITSLSFRKKRILRIDLNSIKLYYLTLSILYEKNIFVRHWHYISNGEEPDFSEEYLHELLTAQESQSGENGEENLKHKNSYQEFSRKYKFQNHQYQGYKKQGIK